jgi:DNA-directed RNA polymerase sigma subunit (sigma70/sigma32)
MLPGGPQLELLHTRYNGRMAPWIIPALKAVLPHVKTIYDTAAPVFTKKKADTVPDPTPLLQQQIAELQSASAQNTAHVKELAGQLQSTVAALQEAAQLAEHRLRRVVILAAVAGALSVVALLAAVASVIR